MSKCTEQGQVHISSQGADSPLALNVDTFNHSLKADQTTDKDGTNSGPSPFEYLLSALGSCMAMTLHVYAKHKNIDLPEFEIVLCQDHTRTDGVTKTDISVNLIVDKTADEELIKKMIEIMHKCPVHRALNGDISTDISVA